MIRDPFAAVHETPNRSRRQNVARRRFKRKPGSLGACGWHGTSRRIGWIWNHALGSSLSD